MNESFIKNSSTFVKSKGRPRPGAVEGLGSTKVNGLKEVYSPKLLEPTSPRCQVIVLVIMSRCMNFTVFSFVMVSNNKKVCTISECLLLLLSNNINKHSPWMLSLEIFWSACAAAADYRQIRCRPSIPAAAS